MNITQGKFDLSTFLTDIPHAISLLKREGLKSFTWRCYCYFVRGERMPLPGSRAEAGTARIDTQSSLQDRLLYFEAEQLLSMPESDIKILAFYFPQFHPFIENDTFWGKGFTEWTNCSKAQPLFNGHLQPRLPGELGFYDTRIKDVLRRQIEMAKTHGIHGICFHHYWFMGRKVMRVPYDMMMANPDLDIPFCLHWANEPWTVRWDGFGGKGGVLLDQQHTPDDDLAFIRDIEPALRDRRYIRIDGKPLLVVYRPSLFPDIRATIDRWNSYCESAGIGRLYLAVMQTCFETDMDPTKYGFDAAIEYPPHNMGLGTVNESISFYDEGFSGMVQSYPALVALNKQRPKPDYTLFRGIIPGWDCTPRRKDPGLFVDQSPWKYQEWLEAHIEYTERNLPPAERFIFINAWNEWAEGAYLDPDRHFGYAYLNATGRALRAKYQETRFAIVLQTLDDELLDELIGYIKNMPYSFNLFAYTLPAQKNQTEAKLYKFVGEDRVEVFAAPEYFRIPAVLAAASGAIRSYDLVCFVHDGEGSREYEHSCCRRYLLNNLLGSADRVEQIADFFSHDRALGIVMPDEFIPPSQTLALAAGAEDAGNTPGPEDMLPMFWFRPWSIQAHIEGINGAAVAGSVSQDHQADTFVRRLIEAAETASYSCRSILFAAPEKDSGDIFAPAVTAEIQAAIQAAPLKLAVVLHLFSDYSAAEIRAYLDNIPIPFDLYLTMQQTIDGEQLRSIFVTCRNVDKIAVLPAMAQGGDIAPFLQLYQRNIDQNYDLLCKVHSRDGVLAESHGTWRKYLFDNLLGSPQIVKTILYYFQESVNLGMLYPRLYSEVAAAFFRDPWKNCWDSCADLSGRLGVSISRGMGTDFPSGAMFWCRPQALAPLRALPIVPADFAGDTQPGSGSLAQAFERLFGLIAQQAGYGTRKVLFRNEERISRLLAIVLPAETGSLDCSIDSIKKVNRIIEIEGWGAVAGQEYRDCTTYLVLKGDAGTFVFSTFGGKRPDVTAACNIDRDDSGFKAVLPLAALGTHSYRVGLLLVSGGQKIMQFTETVVP